MSDTEARCIKCGHPRSNHPFRHPFRPDREEQSIQQLRDALEAAEAARVAAEAQVARLTEALERIAEYLPAFDYVGSDEFGPRSDIPGSPYDRGRDQEAKHLSGIARAALRAKAGEGE